MVIAGHVMAVLQTVDYSKGEVLHVAHRVNQTSS